MTDTLMEQIIKTIDYAVEERAMYFGPHYASSLEGYGDVCRQNVGVQAAVKTVKQAVGELARFINLSDPQELYKELGSLDARCKLLAYESLKMCETVQRYKKTIREKMGGDLTDLIKQFEGLDETEEGPEEPDEPGEE